MQRNLLLGNGINMHINVKEMFMSDIAIRFRRNMILSSPLYELLFAVAFTEEVCIKLFQNSEKIGMESLAERVYTYVLDILKDDSDNTKMRLLDAIICTALMSIFYDESRKIGTEYDIRKLPNMNTFNKIFTLNYTEFWDRSNKCIYLHGQYNTESISENDRPIFLYSLERYRGFKGYDDIICKLSKYYNMTPINTRGIVFSPEFYRKSEMLALGHYPSVNLYPASDFFLHKVKKLYTDLEGIKQIEIFGLSPYGDDNLIEKINDMEQVTIYVYDKNNNMETQEWNKKLTCTHILKDSREIMYT